MTVARVFRPIDRWDQPITEHRTRTPFSATYSDTLGILAREVGMLGGDRYVLMLDYQERHIRRDGSGLLADAPASPATPRVQVVFDSKHGPLRYACDRFTHWQANLRALALGLEALRKVDRFGIGQRGEQYTGYRQLPPGTIALSAPMTRREAARILVDLAGPGWWDDGDNPDAFDDAIAMADENADEQVEGAYRWAVKLHHPDVGGDPALFSQATAARDRLLQDV